MDIKDVMTEEPVTVTKDERVSRVLEIMDKHDVSKLPATKDGGLVGLVTDGDVADELGAQRSAGIDPSSLYASTVMTRDVATAPPDRGADWLVDLFTEDDEPSMVPVVFGDDLVGVVTKADLLPQVDDDTPLRDIMVEELEVVDPDDRIIHARRIMLDEGVERLPVLEAGRVTGILAELDVAQGLARFREEIPSRHQSNQLKEFQVEDAMTRRVVTADHDLPAREAAQRMLDEDVGCLPVVGPREKIQGLVTRTDLIRLL